MRRQPRLCPQSGPEEEEGVPALPVLVSSLTPSFPKRSKRQPTYQYHKVPGWGKLTLPASHSIRLLPYQWVTVTMETSKFLHITGEPACQQPRAPGEAEGSLKQKGLALLTQDRGELVGD